MMRRLAKGLAMLAGLGLLVLPRPSTADGPCAADTAKFCAKVGKQTGAVAKCLKEHEAQLSDVCKQHVARAAAQAKVRKACAADAEKFCKGVEPGQGRIAACLQKHAGDLSASCQAARSANRLAGAAKTPPHGAASGETKAGGK